MPQPSPIRVFEKSVSEVIDWDEDFSDVLESGESVASATASAVDSSGTAVSTVIGTATYSGNVASVALQAGTNLTQYIITLQVVGGSHTYEKKAVLRVRNTPVI